MPYELYPILMFGVAVGILLMGYPVAFSLCGTAILFALFGVFTGAFDITFLGSISRTNIRGYEESDSYSYSPVYFHGCYA